MQAHWIMYTVCHGKLRCINFNLIYYTHDWTEFIWKHLLGTEGTDPIITHVYHDRQKLHFPKDIHTPPMYRACSWLHTPPPTPSFWKLQFWFILSFKTFCAWSPPPSTPLTDFPFSPSRIFSSPGYEYFLEWDVCFIHVHVHVHVPHGVSPESPLKTTLCLVTLPVQLCNKIWRHSKLKNIKEVKISGH